MFNQRVDWDHGWVIIYWHVHRGMQTERDNWFLANWQSLLTIFYSWTSAQIWYRMCQRSFTFGKSESAGITSSMWLILPVQGQDTPQTSQLVRASICTCYRTATHTHTHYFQQSKQKNKLAFKKNKPAALRCLLEPWYEAVITTFPSQPNTERREEQMFAFLRRAIFQQMRSRTTNIDGARGSKQTEQGPCPCWDWAQPFPSSRNPLPAQGWATILPELCKQEERSLKNTQTHLVQRSWRGTWPWPSSREWPGTFPHVREWPGTFPHVGFEADPWAQLLSP